MFLRVHIVFSHLMPDSYQSTTILGELAEIGLHEIDILDMDSKSFFVRAYLWFHFDLRMPFSYKQYADTGHVPSASPLK